jgi:predicted secreted protein
MAHIGKDGVVKIGATAVASIRSFSIDYNSETVDTTKMGDDARTHSATIKTWNASVDAIWLEDTDAGQQAFNVGDSITLNLYPEGGDSADTYYTGTAIVTGQNISTSYDDIVMTSFTAQGSGDLTITTV